MPVGAGQIRPDHATSEARGLNASKVSIVKAETSCGHDWDDEYDCHSTLDLYPQNVLSKLSASYRGASCQEKKFAAQRQIFGPSFAEPRAMKWAGSAEMIMECGPAKIRWTIQPPPAAIIAAHLRCGRHASLIDGPFSLLLKCVSVFPRLLHTPHPIHDFGAPYVDTSGEA